MEYKVIILDFDGVIVDSNNIKHEAFSRIFRRYPDYYDCMMAFHKEHNHLSRQDKFRYLFRELMGKSDCEDAVVSLTCEFEALTRQKIISCAYIKGAMDFIDYFSSLLPMYISSATPEAELRIILKERGLISKFKCAYGQPRGKVDVFKMIIQQERVIAAQVLFVGDSPEDHMTAKEAGVCFMAIKTKESLFDVGTPAFNNLAELKKFILPKIKLLKELKDA